MAQSALKALIDHLRSPALRTRTGIWRVPSYAIGEEANEAVRLGVTSEDISQVLLHDLAPGTRFVDRDPTRIFALVDKIANMPEGATCCLVYNLDLLLAGMHQQEREHLWQRFFNGLPHRPCALLFAVPDTASHLLPPEQSLMEWEQHHRVVR